MVARGAGTATPGGGFVSAYGGDLNVINDLSVENGALRFSFVRTNRERKQKEKVTCRARLVDGKLDGVTEIEGTDRRMEWTGRRAPVIAERDDGSWVEGEKVVLFDGNGMEAWRPNDGWSVNAGILKNNGAVPDLVTKDTFWNFRLQIEYRIAEHSNSGIGLRGRYEIQIVDDFGRAPGTHTSGAIYSRVAPLMNASKPAGEGQTYDIRLIGRYVTVDLNGTRIHDKREIEGLTAIATDPDEERPGPIVLQGDHGPVEFRQIVLARLVKKN